MRASSGAPRLRCPECGRLGCEQNHLTAREIALAVALIGLGVAAAWGAHDVGEGRGFERGREYEAARFLEVCEGALGRWSTDCDTVADALGDTWDAPAAPVLGGESDARELP